MANIPTTGELNFNIIFKNENGETTNGDPQNPSNPKQDGQPSNSNPIEPKNKNTAATLALNTTVTLGKQAANSAISSIGVATGNYRAQRIAQNVASGVETGIGLIAGIATGNFVMVAVSLASKAITAATQYYQQQKQTEIENKTAERNARLYGFSANRNR